MEGTYKIIFRGDIAPGHTLLDVRAQLQELFRLNDQTADKLFSGKPVAIKKNLDEKTAKKWCEVLLRAGALAEYAADDASAPPAPRDAEPRPPASGGGTAPGAPSYGLEVSPVGADVLKPAERNPAVEREVSTSHLTLDQVGADVLREEERTPFVEMELDLSHLRLEDIAAR